MTKTFTIKNKRPVIYEGKTKIIYDSGHDETLILHFKDNLANDPTKIVNGKGALVKQISEYLMKRLDDIGINCHFISSDNSKEQLVHRLEMVPIEVRIRNVAAGRICKIMGLKEGIILPRPTIEICLKSEDLSTPLISDDYVSAFNFASPSEIDDMKLMAIRSNDFLRGLFLGAGIRLIDFKMEFGRVPGTDLILLADEIGPENCRLWGISENEKFDKEAWNGDSEMLIKTYKNLAKRLSL